MAKATNLVIVESPAKAKTIGKYLGTDYEVLACMGHLRDLPKSRMGVDIENDFTPEYMPMKGKEAVIAELRKAAKNRHVYLATDPDREGEAIAWHLQALLELPEDDTKRVTFNEITRKVVCSSIEKPRQIDQDLVDAQQARRVLDRLVGYQLSPFLWKKIRRGLSAGRVQSVAARMVVDREEEIRAFVPEEYWSIDVSLRRTAGSGAYTAKYHGEGKKRELHTEEEVKEILRDVESAPFVVESVKRGEKRRSPAPPFITSTLQQEASRKLGMTPRRTMSVAQTLYEGVDIAGQGTVGLITYMRTDSLRLSDEAMDAAGELIRRRYGSDYHGGRRTYKTKNAAQDAHEAIRPSNVNLDPEMIRGSLTNDQYRLYRLIWSRFLACQMVNAVYDTLSIDTVSAGHVFRANHQSVAFPGFLAVYEEGKDDESEEVSQPLPNLNEGEVVEKTGAETRQHFTQPPARYTEATLVKAMEEQGVGRPSTYATTISTILDRDYVVKQDKRLSPTPLGETVTGLMKERFTDVIDVAFTAQMEEKLDDVEAGKEPWKAVIRSFYADFEQELKSAETALEGKRIRVPEEETDEVCELCGRKMVIKYGRFGRFLACPGFPECTNTRALSEKMPGRCPKCGSAMRKRKSKRGYAYYDCEKGQECGFMTWDVPTEEDCPYCGQTLFKKSGRGQKKTFCINEACENFTPEELRGGWKKKKTEAADTAEKTKAAAAKGKTKKTTSGKSTKTAAGTAKKAKTPVKTKKTAGTGTKTKKAAKTKTTETES